MHMTTSLNQQGHKKKKGNSRGKRKREGGKREQWASAVKTHTKTKTKEQTTRINHNAQITH